MALDPIGTPFLAAVAGTQPEAHLLERVPFDETKEEEWLQRLLAADSGLLPLTSIDDRIEEPLTYIGREIGLSTGSVDILFVSQNGYLVVMETKLWRNPESRRKVVAQVLDYAAQLRKWTYTKLQEEWQRQTKDAKSLYAHVNPEEYEEAEWVDLVNENLSQGRMALLIIGDGIRTETQQLAEVVSGHPDFQFRLGLVELRLYRVDDGHVLAIPATIARTHEIGRVVVRVERVAGPQPAIEVTIPPEPIGDGSVLTEEAFLAEVRRRSQRPQQTEAVSRRLLSLLATSDFLVDWRLAAFVIKYPDPSESGVVFSLGMANKTGWFGLYIPHLKQQVQKATRSVEIAEKVSQSHVERLKRLGATLHGKDTVSMELASLEGKEEEVIHLFEETANALRDEGSKLTRREGDQLLQ